MKTYSDLIVWLIQNKGNGAARRLSRDWDGPTDSVQTASDTLSDVLIKGVSVRGFWRDLYDELRMPDGTPSGEAWQITATFDGETHRLSGTGKLSFLQTLARLGVEADKITA